MSDVTDTLNQIRVVECPSCFNTTWLITETGSGPIIKCMACSQEYQIEQLVNLEGVKA